MPEYTIKYETFKGDCRVVTSEGFNESDAESKLIDCKEVYYTKKKDPLPPPTSSNFYNLKIKI